MACHAAEIILAAVGYSYIQKAEDSLRTAPFSYMSTYPWDAASSNFSARVDVAMKEANGDKTKMREHLTWCYTELKKYYDDLSDLHEKERKTYCENRRKLLGLEASLQQANKTLANERCAAKARLVSERQAAYKDKMHYAREQCEERCKKYQKVHDYELQKEKDRSADLERRVGRLEKAMAAEKAQRAAASQGCLVSAIRKLAKSPSVSKRLAAACHPDKVPAECSDFAAELFRFVQGVRDSPNLC